MSELQAGFFDGEELSAANPINISRYRQTLQPVKGRYDNGSLLMSFPIVVTDLLSTSSDGSGASYYIHIVQETCLMRKKEEL